jgi:dimethylglycine catabolism A
MAFRNRIMSARHASRLTRDDFPQEVYQTYYEEKAKGADRPDPVQAARQT